MKPVELQQAPGRELSIQNYSGNNTLGSSRKIESPFMKILQSMDSTPRSNSWDLKDSSFRQESFAPLSRENEETFSTGSSSLIDETNSWESSQSSEYNPIGESSGDTDSIEDDDSDEDDIEEDGEDEEASRIGNKHYKEESYFYSQISKLDTPSDRPQSLSGKGEGLDENVLEKNFLQNRDINSKEGKKVTDFENQTREKNIIQDKRNNNQNFEKSTYRNNEQASSELKEFEKKILTSTELWDKLQSSVKASSQDDTKSKGKGNIKIISSEEGNQASIGAKDKYHDGSMDVKNKLEDFINKEKESINLKKQADGARHGYDLSGKESREIMESKEPSESKKIGKNIFDKHEIVEKSTDSNRWEIQKERRAQDAKAQSDISLTNARKAGESTPSIQTMGQSAGSSSGESGSSWGDGGRNGIQSLANKLKADKTILPEEQNMTAAQKKENLENLVKQAKIQILGNQKSQAEIRMNPEELGRMVLKISVNKDKVEGKIIVESESLKLSLQNDISQLKEDLRSQGLKLESLEIDLAFQGERDFSDDMGRKAKDLERLDSSSKKISSGEQNNEITNDIRLKSDSLLDIVA